MPVDSFRPEAGEVRPFDPAVIEVRRERTYMVLAGLFLGTLAILNILGITRFIDLSFRMPFFGWHVPMVLAVGVLPYPVTFLCTDFLSEFYGRRRTNFVVWVGLLINLWVVAFLWLGGAQPAAPSPATSTATNAVETTLRIVCIAWPSA